MGKIKQNSVFKFHFYDFDQKTYNYWESISFEALVFNAIVILFRQEQMMSAFFHRHRLANNIDNRIIIYFDKIVRVLAFYNGN